MFEINFEDLIAFEITIQEQFSKIDNDTVDDYTYESLNFYQNFPKINFIDREMFIKFNHSFLRLISTTINQNYWSYNSFTDLDVQTFDNEEFITVTYSLKIGRLIQKCCGCGHCGWG